MFNQILAKIFVAHHPLKQQVIGDGEFVPINLFQILPRLSDSRQHLPQDNCNAFWRRRQGKGEDFTKGDETDGYN